MSHIFQNVVCDAKYRPFFKCVKEDLDIHKAVTNYKTTRHLGTKDNVTIEILLQLQCGLCLLLHLRRNRSTWVTFSSVQHLKRSPSKSTKVIDICHGMKAEKKKKITRQEISEATAMKVKTIAIAESHFLNIMGNQMKCMVEVCSMCQISCLSHSISDRG